IPMAGLALLLGVDRFMSEARAITNLIGNAVATMAVARWEGALDIPHVRRTLAHGVPSCTTKSWTQSVQPDPRFRVHRVRLQPDLSASRAVSTSGLTDRLSTMCAPPATKKPTNQA